MSNSNASNEESLKVAPKEPDNERESMNKNQFLITLLLAFTFLIFGVYIYFDLAKWEASNEQKTMNSILYMLYKIGGKFLVAGFFEVIGLLIIWSVYSKWKMKQPLPH